MTDATNGPAVHLSKHVPFVGVHISLADIASIHDRLLVQVREQAEIEISALKKPPEQSDEDWVAFLANARASAFKIATTIKGRDGSALIGDSGSVFREPAVPARIQSVFLSNSAPYRNFAGTEPFNRFSLMFDFSKPPLFEVGVAISAPTANNTNLEVQGNRGGWIAGVQAAVDAVLQERKTRRRWLHRGFIYDLGLFLFGFPLAFYVCWKTSHFVDQYLAPMGPFIVAVFYLYLGLVTLNVYRGLFGYAKWAFPVVELSDNADAAGTHRAVLSTILVAIFGRIIWEIASLVLKGGA